jgi:hypothetical protein
VAFLPYRIEVGAFGIRVEEPDGRSFIEEQKLDPLNIELLRLMEHAIARGVFTDDESLKAYGQLLYRTLFIGKVNESFRVVRRTMKPTDHIHIRLVFEDEVGAKLSGLSWEFLHSFENELDDGNFFLWEQNITISRLFRVYKSIPDDLVSRDKTLNIWIIVSAPPKFKPILAKRTIEDIKAAVNMGLPKTVRIRVFENPTLRSLVGTPMTSPDQPEMTAEEKPHIIHFIGHGKYEWSESGGVGQVGLTRGDNIAWCTEREFVELIRKINPEPNLIVLQQCEAGKSNFTHGFSGVAVRLYRALTPAVVAMQHPITNLDAIAFSQHFYKKLFESGDVLNALQAGRLQLTDEGRAREDMEREGSKDRRAFGTPVLHLYSKEAKILRIKKDRMSSSTQKKEPVRATHSDELPSTATVNGAVSPTSRGDGELLTRLSEESRASHESPKAPSSPANEQSGEVGLGGTLSNIGPSAIDPLQKPVEQRVDPRVMNFLARGGRR